MTTSGDNVERRVARLERDVARLREEVALAGSDASAARTLAAGADRDVSEVRAELRAHTQALNALRQTQLEQGQTYTQALNALRQTQNALRETQLEQGRAVERLQESVQQQAEVTSDGFATVRSGMTQIVALLDPGPQR